MKRKVNIYGPNRVFDIYFEVEKLKIVEHCFSFELAPPKTEAETKKEKVESLLKKKGSLLLPSVCSLQKYIVIVYTK